MITNDLADDKAIEKTKSALEANGIKVVVVNSGEEAKSEALVMIKADSSVLTVSSMTLKQIGLDSAIDESEHFVSLKKKVTSLPQSEQRDQARRINSAPDYVIGSVQAVTEDGQVLMASNSGSQLSPYAFSAAHVIWVVGTQKIVSNLDQAMRRLNEYVLPLEDKRLLEAYGQHTVLRKMLIINSEVKPDRITMLLVKENLGF